LIGTQLGIEAVLLHIVSSLAYFLLFYFFTRNRYLKIAHISEQIDCVLYNTEYLYIGKQEEGELSILECEI